MLGHKPNINALVGISVEPLAVIGQYRVVVVVVIAVAVVVAVVFVDQKCPNR